MGNILRKQYRETSENKVAFKFLERKVNNCLGPNARIEKGNQKSFFIYELGSLFGYVNIDKKIIAVKDSKNYRRAENLARKIDAEWDWTLEESCFI